MQNAMEFNLIDRISSKSNNKSVKFNFNQHQSTRSITLAKFLKSVLQSLVSKWLVGITAKFISEKRSFSFHLDIIIKKKRIANYSHLNAHDKN